MTFRTPLPFLAVAATLALSLAACGDDSADGAGGGGGTGLTDEAIQPVVDAYAANVRTAYGLALDGALSLQDAVADFVADPTEDTLADARAAWNQARPAYLQTRSSASMAAPSTTRPTGPRGASTAGLSTRRTSTTWSTPRAASSRGAW